VYVLCRRISLDFSLEPIGTAFAVQSHSRRLLLTAGHCVKDYNTRFSLGEFYITSGIGRTDNGYEYLSEPIRAFLVEVSAPEIDVACLEVETPFQHVISVCPSDEIPDIIEEDQVKVYHCAVFPFLEGETPALNISASRFDKLAFQSYHHIFLNEGMTRGSSGGPVVDKYGRLVGIIQAGVRPGPNPLQQVIVPEASFLNVLWDAMTHMSNSYITYVKAIVPSRIPNLLTFLQTH
jgi:hypothetical protein